MRAEQGARSVSAAGAKGRSTIRGQSPFSVRQAVELAQNPLFAYGSLLALQAKVMWGIWRFKDLTAGDTAYYFVSASRWAEDLRTNPVGSPLYLIFYGSLQWVFSDPFILTIVHRLLIVAALDLLVLAVLRCLLPFGLAWILAAWFALLPINFDSLYEAHLFAALPGLLAALLVARAPGHLGRAAALSILLVSALLVRSEAIITAGLWASFCLFRDGRGSAAVSRRRVARAYLSALLFAGAAWGLVYWRSPRDMKGLLAQARAKHTLNVCQIYAFGYEQRHRDFSKSPWTDCQELMLRDFGRPEPTLLEALRANPRAMLAHFAWNARLIPSGLQLQLFNAVSGPLSPDYIQPRVKPALVTTLSLGALGVLVTGAVLLWRERSHWWQAWLRERADTWVLLLCLVANGIFVMLMQRPRPSYLFHQCVVLLTMIGMATLVIRSRWPSVGEQPWLVPALWLGAILLVPPYYHKDMRQALGQTGQPLRQAVERLGPFRRELAGSAHGLATLRFPFETCAYLGRSEPCTAISFAGLAGDQSAASSPALRLDEQHIDWVYAEELAMGDPRWQPLLQMVTASGRWRQVAPREGVREGWALFRRQRN